MFVYLLCSCLGAALAAACATIVLKSSAGAVKRPAVLKNSAAPNKSDGMENQLCPKDLLACS